MKNNRIATKYAGVHDLTDDIRDFYEESGVGEYYSDYQNIEFPLPATYLIDSERFIRYFFADADYRKRAEPTEILLALRALHRPGTEGHSPKDECKISSELYFAKGGMLISPRLLRGGYNADYFE